ncbi:MAG: hypothetical protein HY072_06335, partial [Deltaproteobacteria bacterium]|nr:hypothetical protein [Deltaproteobacteria bacterium]
MELPHLARQYILSRRKVLVLGQEPLTEHIAKELSHEGFEIVYEKDLEHKFPDSSEHDIILKLRSFFLAFIGSSNHENTSFWVHPCVST